MQLFFALTLLVSATLLFLIQPMFAKMVLPRLGGTPAVWNTCMVFYQAVLLAGYLYAHLATRWLGTRRQAAVHLVILCLPWLALPIGVTSTGMLPTDHSPIPWLLGCLTLSVGLPFLVVSASAPMLQAWFADTGHPAGQDPYFLYAASNLGSLTALLGYPILVEPHLTLAAQSWCWSVGYGVLMALTVGCAIGLWRSTGPDTARLAEVTAATDDTDVVPTWAARARWLALSFAPSSLLLGVTTYISTDIAAVPLLWVIPLALYLLTFVLVFARWPLRPYQAAQRWAAAAPLRGRFLRGMVTVLVEALHPHQLLVWVQPFLLIPLAVVFFRRTAAGMDWMVLLHLVAFFVTAMVCHGELARSRPQARYLTEFYIWMSVGGVLGGLFNALLAPVAFTTILEYPLVVALACMLRPTAERPAAPARARWFDLLVPLGLLAALKLAAWGQPWRYLVPTPNLASGALRPELLALGLAGLVAFTCQRRPARFGACVGVMLLAGQWWFNSPQQTVFTGRSFFGVIKVQEATETVAVDRVCVKHTLVHGSTTHGEQRRQRTPDGREPTSPHAPSEPLAYYSRTGPLGQVFRTLIDPARHKELGVVGLGTGTIAAWGQPGQTITCFEIDPVVVRVAQDPRYFTYLADCPATIEVALGDARLKLEEQPDHRFDLLVIDAFSSDAIPLHMITREAFGLYLRKLQTDGVLMVHISNRHLELAPVIANLAADAGLACRRCKDTAISNEEARQGKLGSEWVVLVRDVQRLGSLAQAPTWDQLPTEARVGLWTDDFSNILTVLNWFRRA